jgi:potassium large conductance calcium-activated channel subfamily M alpha protein 1
VEDAAQIVKALAVHRFCGDQVRVIVEVLEPETQNSAVWDEMHKGAIEVICPVKIHYKMIARSCLVKGLYTFITNLFTSEIKIRGLPEHSFIREYFHSFDNEIYPLILPKACHGMLFEEVHLAISLQDWVTPPSSVITGFFFFVFGGYTAICYVLH